MGCRSWSTCFTYKLLFGSDIATFLCGPGTSTVWGRAEPGEASLCLEALWCLYSCSLEYPGTAPLTCTLHCSSRQMPLRILLLGAGVQVWGGRRGHGFPSGYLGSGRSHSWLSAGPPQRGLSSSCLGQE